MGKETKQAINISTTFNHGLNLSSQCCERLTNSRPIPFGSECYYSLALDHKVAFWCLATIPKHDIINVNKDSFVEEAKYIDRIYAKHI